MAYDVTRQFSQTVLYLLQSTEKTWQLKPFTLGGSSGSVGGGGTPPGGWIGQIPQKYVCFDTTEASSSGSVGGSGSTPSLVDNLNRIRYDIRHIQEGWIPIDGGLGWTSGSLYATGVTFLDAEGYPANVTTTRAYGTSAYAARRDHVHTIALGANLSWSSGSLSATGVTFSDAEGYPANVASAYAYGTSLYPTRRDHVHTMSIGTGLAWSGNTLTATGTGNITGTGTTGQVGIWSGSAVMTGYDNLTYDGDSLFMSNPLQALNFKYLGNTVGSLYSYISGATSGVTLARRGISSEQLTNTGFEVDLSGWTVTVSAINGYCDRVNTQSHSGSWSLWMTCLGDTSDAGTALAESNKFAVTPGQTVQFTFWEKGAYYSNQYFQSEIKFYTSGSVFISKATYSIPTSTTWVSRGQIATAPATAAYASVALYTQGGVAGGQDITAYMDDCSAKVGSVLSEIDLDDNGVVIKKSPSYSATFQNKSGVVAFLSDITPIVVGASGSPGQLMYYTTGSLISLVNKGFVVSGNNSVLIGASALPTGWETYNMFGIVRDDVTERFTLWSFGSVAPAISGFRARGSLASPSAVQTDDILFTLSGRGYTSGGAYPGSGPVYLDFRAAENWTATAQGAYFYFGCPPTGTYGAIQMLKISESGLEFYSSGSISAGAKVSGAGTLSMTAGQTYTFGSAGGTIPTAAGTLSVSTTNAISAAGVITHAITSSSNPGAAASILATSASGTLELGGNVTLDSNLFMSAGNLYFYGTNKKIVLYDNLILAFGGTDSTQDISLGWVSSDDTFRFAGGTNLTSTPWVTLKSATMGIGTIAPNASAILDVVSTTKAFMPPRMTTTQRDAISGPTAGMVIYNSTTNKLNVYTTGWEAVTSA